MTHERTVYVGKQEGQTKPYYFMLNQSEIKEYKTKKELLAGVNKYLKKELDSFDF